MFSLQLEQTSGLTFQGCRKGAAGVTTRPVIPPFRQTWKSRNWSEKDALSLDSHRANTDVFRMATSVYPDENPTWAGLVLSKKNQSRTEVKVVKTDFIQ